MANAVIDQILSKIGKKVEFTYPGDEGKKHGILRETGLFLKAIMWVRCLIGTWSISLSLKANQNWSSYGSPITERNRGNH